VRSLRAVRWLTLKVYGSNLLLPDAATWIFSVRLLMLFLISAECASWGYAAYVMGRSELACVACGFAVLAAFTLNWTLDGSLMMLDRDTVFSRTLFADAAGEPTLKLRYKVLLLVLGRLMMIVVVLYASSAFLVQAIFHKDIENRLANENKNRIALKEHELLAPLAARNAELRDKLAQKERELVDEVQGRSRTHKKGCGSACRVLSEQRDRLRQDLQDNENRQLDFERIFEHSTPAELKDRFNIELLGDGLEARGQIVEQLKHNDAFQRTERAIQGLLAILFVGLLLLKMFEPPSVALYYCAVLQGLYADYVSGALNKWLRPEEYPDGPRHGMSPHAFAVFAIMVYGRQKLVEEFKLKLNTEEASYAASIEVLDRRRSDVDRELEAINGRMTAISAEVTKVEAEAGRLQREAETLDVRISALDRERACLQSALGSRKLPVKGYSRILERLGVVEEELSECVANRALGLMTVDGLKRKLTLAQIEKESLADQISKKQNDRMLFCDEKDSREWEYLQRLKSLAREHDMLLHGGSLVGREAGISSVECLPRTPAIVN
jgi:hypothetical protein